MLHCSVDDEKGAFMNDGEQRTRETSSGSVVCGTGKMSVNEHRFWPVVG